MRCSLLLLGIFLSCLLLPAHSNTTYTIICTDNSAGYCTTWSADQSTAGGCFPADTTLLTPLGFKTMGELQKGDKVLGLVDGEETFTMITSWFHKEDQEVEYLRISVKQGQFDVSAKHSLVT